MFAGKLSVADGASLTLAAGSYAVKPDSSWIAEGALLVQNYDAALPWSVAKSAWEASLTSRLADTTGVTLDKVDEEIRFITIGADGSTDMDDITFSSGDWRHLVHTNKQFHVAVFAVAAEVVTNGSEQVFSECGKRVLLYTSRPEEMTTEEIDGQVAFGREDAFSWTKKKSSVGLIKMLHYTMRKIGSTLTTNRTEIAYFKFPDVLFNADQRAENADEWRIIVRDTMLEALGYDRVTGFDADEVQEILNTDNANGLKTWEALVTGTDTNNTLVAASTVTGEGKTATIGLVHADEHVIDKEYGYDVAYELCKSTPDGWVRVGEVQETPSFRLDLLGDDNASKGATGFYRLTTLIIPDDNPAITNAVPSTNIIGVLEVASSSTNTMMAVPWVSIVKDEVGATIENIHLSGHAEAAHLSGGDIARIVATDETFLQWRLNAEKNGWTKSVTAVAGSDEATDPGEADAFEVPRDSAVWLTRSQPKEKPIFLIGQYSPDPVTLTIAAGSTSTPSCTLVTNPSFDDLSVNDGSWGWGATPAAKDQISIPNGNSRVLLRWNKSLGKWYGYVPNPNGAGQVKSYDFIIKAGTGFWYYRRGEAFEVTLPQSKPYSE